jgi:hypothetical protein
MRPWLLTRRSVLKLGGVLALQQACAVSRGLTAEAPVKLCLFKQGKWRAAVCCDTQASQQVHSAATLLAQYGQRSTGVPIAVAQQPPAGQIRIQVGESKDAPLPRDALTMLDGDGFIIDFPDTQTARIVGATDWGTEFGVYEFLERYLGVRWLLPGPQGEYVPQLQELTLMPEPVRQQPAFTSRLLSGLRGEEQLTWARRQRQHGRIEFHHNLRNLFPSEQYTRTHPHFFPLLKGKRYLPTNNAANGWQLCFSAEDIVDEAVKNICDYFAQHPDATSYSLAVNDGHGYCECDLCAVGGIQRKNVLGLVHTSDAYFRWANAVVARVLDHYPDKWFGCLAYRAVIEPPTTTKVHPRLVPFLTYDRMKWASAIVAAEGKRLTESWQRATRQLGWYDYIYGTPYCVPRVYFHTMADYYRYGAQHQVSAMYAEAYPNWGEGPKLYIALKLQWDPTQDVEALLREWCEKAVGEDAAPELVAYYTLWEHFWTNTVVSSSWFGAGRNEYLGFGRPEYLDLITDEILRSRALLEAVVRKTKTTDQQARADILFRAFTYYEASALSYAGLKKKATVETGPAEILAPEETKNHEYYRTLAAKRRTLVDEFQHDPVLKHPLPFVRYKTLRW